MEDLTGKQLGPYKLIEQLGKGGMGAVYRAHQAQLNRDIAIKVLPLHLASDPVFLARFEQEAAAAARLIHPHIVQVYDYGESNGYHYITMQFIESRKTLRNRLQGQPLELLDLRRVTIQIGGALDYAHQHRVVHRDVKPANILFSEAQFYYLTDFGIAKDLDRAEHHTQVGTSIGTARYMSPEQFRGEVIDGRSDLYSLGVVMYEMATGHVPFESTTPFMLQRDHQMVSPPPPRNLNPDLSPELEEIILKLLAKDRDDRYATGQALLADLRKAIADDGSRPSHPVEVDKLIAEYPPTENIPVPDAAPAPPPVAPPAQAPPPRSSGKFKSRLLWLMIIPVCLCAGLAGAFVWGGQLLSGTPTPTPPLIAAVATTSSPPAANPVEPAVSPTDSIDTPINDVTPTSPSAQNGDSPTASPTPTPTLEPTTAPEPAEAATATPLPTEEAAPEATATPTPLPAAEPAAADMSGNLAIPLMYGNEPKVYAVDSSGNLQNIIGAARQPDYTLDGSKLVVDGHGGSDDKLRISDPLGNGTYQIGDMGLTEHSHPAWSPDGTRVVYDDATVDPSGTRIYFGDLKERQGPGEELRAAAGPIIAQYPLWTSRGFVFRGCNTWANQPGQCGLWLMPENGDEPAQLTDNPRHIPVDTRGDTLAYVSDEAGNWNVHVLDMATGQTRQLTDNPAADGLPAISPDGQTVAYLSNRDGKFSVWAVPVSGGASLRLFDLPADWGELRADGWAEEKLSWGAK